MKIEDLDALEIEDLFSKDESKSFEIKKDIEKSISQDGCLPKIIKNNYAFMKMRRYYDAYYKMHFAEEWFNEVDKKIQEIISSDDMLLTKVSIEMELTHPRTFGSALIELDARIPKSCRALAEPSNLTNKITLSFTRKKPTDDYLLYEQIELDFKKFVSRTQFEIDKIYQKDKFTKAQELKKQGA